MMRDAHPQKKLNPFARFLARIEASEETLFSIASATSDELVEVSGAEFHLLVAKWAAVLDSVEDEVIPIFGRLTPSMLAACFGVAAAGKLPTYISYPNSKIDGADYTKKLQNYSEQFENSLFIGEADETELVPNLLTPAMLKQPLPAEKFRWRSEDEPLFVQSSSGTTGMQKAVAIRGEQLQAQIDSYSRALDLNGYDHIVSWLPLYHDMGLIATLMLPMLTGTPVTYLDTFDWLTAPESLLRWIETQRGTLVWLPNFAFSFLTRVEGDYDLSSVRSFVNCSEPATSEAFDQFAQRFGVEQGQLAVSYALAENVFAVTQTPPGTAAKRITVSRNELQNNRVVEEPEGQTLVCCGPIIEGTEVRIDTQSGEEIGRVMIRGNCNVDGYFRRDPQLEAGWLDTGDLGFIHGGELFITGRAKDLIIVQGKNIYPQDIEQILNSDKRVHKGRVVAAGMRDEELGTEKVLALVEPEPGMTFAERRELEAELKRQIDRQFAISSQVAAVPTGWLRKTSSGKIARKANVEKYLEARESSIYVIGNSHVKILRKDDPQSLLNAAENVHPVYLGLFKAAKVNQFSGKLFNLIRHMRPQDTLVLHTGEIEISHLIAGAPDPYRVLEETLVQYLSILKQLRAQLPGQLAYMSTPPTNPVVVGVENWPSDPFLDQAVNPLSTPEKRANWERAFYGGMKEICGFLNIPYLPLNERILNGRKLIDESEMRDERHLSFDHQGTYFDLFDEHLGFIRLGYRDDGGVEETWDGSREHFEKIMRALILAETVTFNESTLDWDHLLSSGVVDSLGLAHLIYMMTKRFDVVIRASDLQRSHFESIDKMYEQVILPAKARQSSGNGLPQGVSEAAFFKEYRTITENGMQRVKSSILTMRERSRFLEQYKVAPTSATTTRENNRSDSIHGLQL